MPRTMNLVWIQKLSFISTTELDLQKLKSVSKVTCWVPQSLWSLALDMDAHSTQGEISEAWSALGWL